MTTEQIKVSRKDREFFENACYAQYISPRVIDDSQEDAIEYELIIDYPAILYYLGRAVQIQISHANALEIIKGV